MPKAPLGNLTSRETRRIQRICFGLFARHGYDRTSMKMITGALKAADGYLYYYFAGKEDLVRWLIDVGTAKWFADFQKVVIDNPPSDVYALFKATLFQTVHFIRHNRDMYGTYFKFITTPTFPLLGYLAERISELDSNYGEQIKAGIAQKRFRKDLCPDTAAILFDGVAVRIHEFVFNPVLDPLGVAKMNDEGLEELVETFVSIFDRGIAALP